MKQSKIERIADRGDALLADLQAAARAIDEAAAAGHHEAEAAAVERVATIAADLRALSHTRGIRHPTALRWLLGLRGLCDVLQLAVADAHTRARAMGGRLTFTGAERLRIATAIQRLATIN